MFSFVARSVLPDASLFCFAATAGLLESEDFKEALEGFQQVVTMENEKGEWYAPTIPS